MAIAIASVRSVRIAPRKVRLVADLIRGKKVADAIGILRYTPKVSAPIIRKVLESAVANAEHAAAESRARINSEEMIVSRIVVNEGPTGRRFIAGPRGRAMKVRKRSSQIELTISDQGI